MRFLRALPLFSLILALPFLLSAACVTRVDQKGLNGPWIGEVTNNGPDAMTNLYAWARIFDANWNIVGFNGVPVCPPLLAPGQKGFYQFDFWSPNNVALPLHALFNPLTEGESAIGYDISSEGLVANVFEENASQPWPYIGVEITNNSPRTYSDVSVCSVLHNSDGSVAAVGGTSLFPTILRSGEKGTIPIYLASLPDGLIDLFPVGSGCCESSIILSTSLFHITAKKIVTIDQGRQLEVVGEMDNPTGQDLADVMLQTYVQGERGYWVWANVGWEGLVPRGTKAPVDFSLPLRPNDFDAVVAAGVEANPGLSTYLVPVSNLTSQPANDYFHVSATLSNPTTFSLHLLSARLNLRAANGGLVGSINVILDQDLAPGATTPVFGDVMSLVPAANVKTAEVISYADVYGQPEVPSPPY